MSVDESAREHLIEMKRQREAMRDDAGLRGGGGGGTSGGVSDDATRSQLHFLHTALLGLAGVLIIALLAVAFWIASASSNTDQRYDRLAERISVHDRELGRLRINDVRVDRRLARDEARAAGRDGGVGADGAKAALYDEADEAAAIGDEEGAAALSNAAVNTAGGP